VNLGLESGGTGVAGAAGAALLAGAYFWHASRSPAPRGLLILRALGAAALALAVLRPTATVAETRLAKPRLLILLDSGSAMRGKAPGGTRWTQATGWLAGARAEIERRADATVVLVSDRARVLGGLERLRGAGPDAAAFDPAGAVTDSDAFGGPAPSRVWLISDGGAEGGGDLGRALAGLGAPVDALGVGPARRDRGAAFTDLKTPDFAFLHDSFSVRAEIEASDLAGKTVTTALSRADDEAPGGWREVGVRRRAVGADLETFTSTFTAAAERLGAEHWRLTASAEGRTRVREFRVEVVRQKYRIMYLAGRPSSEYAFLREFLKSDANHELVSFVILRNPENPSPASDRDLSLIPFPVDDIFIRTLPKFDLFILENFSAARFRLPPSHLEALKRFVASGGALLVKGGENAFSAGGYKGSPIEDVLPVALSVRSPDFVPGLFTPKPTSYEHPLVKLFDTAEESRKAWDGLPPLDGWGRFAAARSGAQIVAVHPTETAEDGSPLPVIAMRSYGRGKVMLVSTDSTWRWKLGAAGDRLASGVYERFWTRAVQYLTGSLDLSKVKFAPLPDRVAPREPFTASLRVFDTDFSPAKAAETRVTVLWTPPGAPAREVAARETEPGLYVVELTGLAPGAHRLRATARVRGRAWGEDAETFAWEPAVDAPMDRAWLSRAAASGGGEFHDLSRTKAEELLAQLPPARPESETMRRFHPFSSPLWLALSGFLLLLEWALRRRKGHA
jgi:uncharacterized membrane protein